MGGVAVMAFDEMFQLIIQFGLPLVMFVFVVVLSIRGDVIWRPTHEALLNVYRLQLQDVTAQRDKFAEIALQATAATERATSVAEQARQVKP